MHQDSYEIRGLFIDYLCDCLCVLEINVTKCQATSRAEDASFSSTKRMDGWKNRASRRRTKLGLPVSSHPWCAPTGPLVSPPFLQGISPQSERAREIVNEGWWTARKNAPAGQSVAQTAANLFINISQNPDRISPVVGLATFTRNAMFYSYQYDVVVSGHAHLRALGWPRAFTDTHRRSDATMRDLSGDAVSLCVYMSIESVMYHNPFAAWWR